MVEIWTKQVSKKINFDFIMILLCKIFIDEVKIPKTNLNCFFCLNRWPHVYKIKCQYTCTKHKSLDW